MRKFWGTCNNSNYLVGCNGSTIYVYDKNEKEVAKFKDANYVYRAKFIPNTNILIAKSTAGFLVIYNLDELKLVKKIKVSLIGAQDEGFIITPDRKYLYNIEKPLYSTKTQLTIYDTLNFEVVKILFKNNDKVVLKNLEFDEESEICYVLGFMRDDTGVYDYGFIGKLLDDKIIEIKKIDKKRYDYISAYKSWEDTGFTDKALEWSRLKLEEKIENISLTEIYKMLDNQNKTKKKSIIQKLFGK